MKKIFIVMLAISLLLSLASCEIPFLNGSTTTTTGDGGITLPELPEYVKELKGLNESIFVLLDESFDYEYEIFYKKSDDGEYSRLDKNLMIKGEEGIECYILGISSGDYSLKINISADESFEIDSISVAAQDRSGYAHFGATEGVGAYNNDGTIKDGTKIIYVTNENKNTVTCNCLLYTSPSPRD